MAGPQPGEPARRPGGPQRIPRPPSWLPGSLPPWHGATRRLLSVDHVLDAVVAHGSREPAPVPPLPGPSAVLVALRDGRTGAEVLLTRRSMEVRSHQGEVSFPGGRLEEGESFRQAALREAHEEVALPPASVSVVGSLDTLTTVRNPNVIVPVVGRVAGDPPLRALEAEVARILWVPLSDFLREGTYREEIWGGDLGERSIHFFELDDETVWGATARILHQLLRIALVP